MFLSASGAVLAQANDAQPTVPDAPRTLFQLDFEDGWRARAEGREEPLQEGPKERLSAGLRGRGVRLGETGPVRYSASENLKKDAGALSVWIRVDAAASGAAPVALLSEDGPDEPGSTRLRIEYFPGRFVRVSLNDPKSSQVFYHGAAHWVAGEWHHLAVSWNPLKGSSIHVDGQLAGIGWMPQWSPQRYESFSIGPAAGDAETTARVTVDELRIFDRALTDHDARRLYLEFRSFRALVAVRDPFVPADQPADVLLSSINPGEAPLHLRDLTYRVVAPDGSVVQRGDLPDQQLAGSARSTMTVPLQPSSPGRYTLEIAYREDGQSRTVESPLVVVAPAPAAKAQPEKLVLLTEIDAVTQEPVASTGGSFIRHAEAGTYREAGGSAHDRFALDFHVKDVDQPHVAIITYPDDKARTMEVLLQDFGGIIDFQAHSGLYTGDEFPLSGAMREHRIVFWPRSERQAFTFMTAEAGRPAAVGNIRIFRLEQFAVTDRTQAFDGRLAARSTGLYYEDPVLFHNFGTGRDLPSFMEATDRLVQYLLSFGQTEFEYPLAWYGGPLYGTATQPLQPDIEGGQGGVRPHPPGFPRYLLQRLGEQNIRFTAGLHIHTLPSLNDAALADRALIDAGQETAININQHGELWYGHWHGRDPNFNAADPRVMGAVDAVVDEILARYADEAAFDGISLIIARPKVFSFGSLASGYNDSNLQRFQRETGITIPGYDRHDPSRFTKASTWLLAEPQAKRAWINWRCRVLYDHYARMAARMAGVRPDLKLKLNVFIHPSRYGDFAEYLTKPAAEFAREMGIDPSLYRGHPNIVLNHTFIPADYRWMRRSDYLPDHPGVARTVLTAPEVSEPFADEDDGRVTIHDRYWEDAIGREQPLPGLTKIGVQEMVWRASTLNPAGFNSLEPYIFALHHLDATSIVKGGYVVGTLGMETELEPFARALATLPATRFDDVPAAVDPVRIRQQVVGGELYIYVLNTLPEPVEAEVRFATPGELIALENEARQSHQGRIAVALSPYQLVAYKSTDTLARVSGAEVTVSERWRAGLERRLQRLMAAADAAGPRAEARRPYLDLAQQAWDQGHLSRLYFLLQEHWAVDLLGTGVAQTTDQ